MVRFTQLPTGSTRFRPPGLRIHNIWEQGMTMCYGLRQAEFSILSHARCFHARCRTQKRYFRIRCPGHKMRSSFIVCFLVQNEGLPAPLRIQRVPTPQWAAAQDRKARQELQRKHEVATSLKELKDEHFSDFEGNLRVQKARASVLATRLKPPKGWGAQHTHVSVRWSACLYT